MQVRTFNEGNIDKIDKVMKYLESNSIPYTAHWVGIPAAAVEARRLKAEAAGKEFNAAKIPLMQITWFG